MKKGFKKLLGAALSVAMLSQGMTFAVSAETTYDYDTSKNILFGMDTSAASVQLSRWNGNSAGWKRSCLMNGISVSANGTESDGSVWYAPAAADTQTSVTFNLAQEYTIDTVEVTSGYLHKNSVTGYEYLDSYWVEYWNGSAFVKAEGSEVTGNEEAVSGTSFTAVTSNKFRLVTNTANAVRVREVRLWLEGTAPEIIETPEEVNLISGVAVSEASPAVDAAVLTDGQKVNGSAGWTVDSGYDYEVENNVLFGMNIENIALSHASSKEARACLVDGYSTSALGNSTTKWYVTANADKKYVEFTLDKEYYVDAVRVTSSYNYGGNEYPDSFYVEYWNGTEFVKVADSEVTGNADINAYKEFTAVKSNRFRLSTETQKTFRLREIELFAADVDGYDNTNTAVSPSYVVLPLAEKENVTHIALYTGSGEAGAFAQGINPENVKIYYNDGAASSWTAAKLLDVNSTTQETNNLTLKARQITYLEIEPVVAKNIKVEIYDSDFILMETEVYYAESNKLFGTVAETVVEAGGQEWGNSVNFAGFVLTDGVSNNPNNIGKWYLYNTQGAPYAQLELGGETIDTVKIWSGTAARGEVTDTYRTKIAYSDDGAKWTEALIRNVEYSRSGSTELKDVMTITTGAITAKYLRVYINSQEESLGAIRVKEIAAYNNGTEAADETFTVVSATLDEVAVKDMQTDVANNAEKLTLKLLSTPEVVKVGGKQYEFTVVNGTTIEVDMPKLAYNTWFDVEADGIRLLTLKTIPEVSVTNKSFVKADGNIVFYGVITDNANVATDDTKLIFTTEKNGVLNAVNMEDVTFGTENSISVADGENPSVYLWSMEKIVPLAKKVVNYAVDEVVVDVDEDGFTAYVKNDASTDAEYIGYWFCHEVSESANADLYRIKGTKLYERLDDFAFVPVNDVAITGNGEYEMAIKEKSGDGADFVGGFHGDEVIDSVTMTVDGKEVSLSENGSYKGQSIVFTQNATVNASGTPDLKLIDHEKIYTITKDGIKLNQTAEWLNDSTVSEVYMAMLPVNLKTAEGVQINDTITAGGASYYRPGYFAGVKFNVGYTNALSVTATGGDMGAKVEVTTKPVQGFADSDIQFFMYTRETNDNKVYFRSLRSNNNTFAVNAGEVWEVENTYKVTVE